MAINHSNSLSPPLSSGFTWEQLGNAMVFLMAAISFFVYIEPAPVDLLFFATVLFFLRSGLNVSIAVAPLVLLLVLYNLGGFISAIPVFTKEKTMMFVLTSSYMAMTAIFFAFYLSYDPVNRYKLLRAGLIVGGVLAATLGLIDYLQIGGLFPNSLLKGRATGTFKDPNVFSTYLIPPALMLMHGLMTGSTRHKMLSVLALALIMAGVFLAFSRGAWINFVAASTLLALLTFLTTGEAALRRRIVFFMIAALALVAVAFTMLMSFESVRTMFQVRFSLLQSYDAGETGRFGNQLNAIPLLMELPLGYGPLQFRYVFGIDPHNTFINAFASYGWLGGLSYIALVVTTVVVGFKTILIRTPWQPAALVVFCPLLTTILQGVQIDIDHWRHFYWLIGMMWGLFAASVQPAAVFERLKVRHAAQVPARA